MNYAPSIRDYRSEAEWQRDMEIWCAENEPAFKLYDDEGRPVFKSKLDLYSNTFNIPSRKRYYPPHYTPRGGCPDKLAGGSRADYRMAGITRY